MRRFKFELEKILDLRKHKEKETEIALGKAVGALNEIEHRIALVDQERERMSKTLPQSTADFFAHDRYTQRLVSSKANYLKEAEKATVKVNEAREIYLAASRDRKVLDKVKENRQSEYRKFLLSEETKTLDDLSNSRFAENQAKRA